MIDRILRKYARSIDPDRGYSAHSMRATFITTALDNGASLEDVQSAAGHAIPQPRSCMTAEGTIRRSRRASCKLLNGLREKYKSCRDAAGRFTACCHQVAVIRSPRMAGRSVGGIALDWRGGLITVEDTDPKPGLYASPRDGHSYFLAR